MERFTSYTIYEQPMRVGITIKPTPSLTKNELIRLIIELQNILALMVVKD